MVTLSVNWLVNHSGWNSWRGYLWKTFLRHGLTRALLRSHGWHFETKFPPKFHPVMMGALLITLVLIFAFQSKNLPSRWVAVLLIAVPGELDP